MSAPVHNEGLSNGLRRLISRLSRPVARPPLGSVPHKQSTNCPTIEASSRFSSHRTAASQTNPSSRGDPFLVGATLMMRRRSSRALVCARYVGRPASQRYDNAAFRCTERGRDKIRKEASRRYKKKTAKRPGRFVDTVLTDRWEGGREEGSSAAPEPS